MRRISLGQMYSRYFTFLGLLLMVLLVVFGMGVTIHGCTSLGNVQSEQAYNAETDLPMATYVFAYYAKPEIIDPMQKFCVEATLAPDASILKEVMQKYLDEYKEKIFDDPILAEWLIMRLQKMGITLSPDLILDESVNQLPFDQVIVVKQNISYICKGIQWAFDRRVNEGK